MRITHHLSPKVPSSSQQTTRNHSNRATAATPKHKHQKSATSSFLKQNNCSLRSASLSTSKLRHRFDTPSMSFVLRGTINTVIKHSPGATSSRNLRLFHHSRSSSCHLRLTLAIRWLLHSRPSQNVEITLSGNLHTKTNWLFGTFRIDYFRKLLILLVQFPERRSSIYRR